MSRLFLLAPGRLYYRIAALLLLSLSTGIAQAQSGPIVIGQTADFSGPQSALVKETTAAAKAYFNKINEQGGIRGRKIELKSVDDGFDVGRTVSNARELAKDKSVVAYMLSRGTANAEALLPVLAELKIPLLGPVGGSRALHTPANRYMFNLRPPFQTEVSKAIGQLTVQGISQLAVVYTDDAFGKDALIGFDRAMAERQLKPVSRVSIPRGSSDVAAAVDQLGKAEPQAIIGLCIIKGCVSLVSALRAKGINSQFVSLSNTSSEGYIKELGVNSRGVIVTQVFPHPQSGVSALAKELRELAGKANFVASYTTMEGMIAAKVMVEALRRAGDNPTPEKITTALESLHNYDMGGYTVNYSPDDRTASEFVDLSIISKEGRFIR
jgi:branched-chain amino acid transport system substrate-binding protein